MNRRDQKGRRYRETDRRKTSQKPAWARTEGAAAERSACGGRSVQRRGRAGPTERPAGSGRGPGASGACQPHAVEGLHASFRCPAARPQGSLRPAIGRGGGPPGQVGAEPHPPCSGSPPHARTVRTRPGRRSRLAKLAFGLSLWAVLGSLSHCESSLCPGLGCTDPGLGRTRHRFQNAFLPQHPHFAERGRQDPERLSGLPQVAQPGWGTSRCRPQTLAPAHSGTAPHLPRRAGGW